jgi:hypothetical protein
VKQFFRHVENSLGESIKPERISNTSLQNLLMDFFNLKEHWPYKAAENRLGKYYFSESEYAIARIEYRKRWSVPESKWDKILVSLESEFDTLKQLRNAEQLLQDKTDAFIQAYSQTL